MGSFSTTPVDLNQLKCLHLLRRSATYAKTSASVTPVSRLTRRRFIRSTALVGGTAIATRLLSTPAITQVQLSETPPAIAIVGGRIAGLNAAYQLKKMGLTATLYEAKPQVGGRTPSVTEPVGIGLVLDPGGHFINTDHDDILSLADELRLPLFNRVEDAERSPIAAISWRLASLAHSSAHPSFHRLSNRCKSTNTKSSLATPDSARANNRLAFGNRGYGTRIWYKSLANAMSVSRLIPSTRQVQRQTIKLCRLVGLEVLRLENVPVYCH